MTTLPQAAPAANPRRRPKAALSVRFTPTNGYLYRGILFISLGKKTTGYFLRCLLPDFGKAYRLEKFLIHGGECYDVLIDGDRTSCDCMGFIAHGRCKHVDSLKGGAL